MYSICGPNSNWKRGDDCKEGGDGSRGLVVVVVVDERRERREEREREKKEQESRCEMPHAILIRGEKRRKAGIQPHLPLVTVETLTNH